MIDKLKQYYKQSVITCVWYVSRGYRQLIFGQVEFIPNFLGDEESIGEQELEVKNGRIYFIRHVSSTEIGYEWYKHGIEEQNLDMPWDDNRKTIEFHSKDEPYSMVQSSRFPKTRFDASVPFKTKLWDGAQMHHFMPAERLSILETLIVQENYVASWLGERLLWPIDKHFEYIGSNNFIVPNPFYVHSRVRLEPADNDSPEAVIVRQDRDCSGKGIRIFLQEKALDAYDKIITDELPIKDGKMSTSGNVDEIGYFVVDNEGNVLERHEYSPFLRKINLDFHCHDTLKIIKSRDGSEQKISSAVRISQTIGENNPEGFQKLKNKICRIQHSRADNIAGGQQYFFFKQGGQAESLLRKILLGAFKKLTIIDPYFSASSATMFLATLNHDIDVFIVTTAAGFKTEGDVGSFREMIKNFSNGDKRIEVIVAGTRQLHDRFIIVDEKEVWMLGSSMKSLGDSLSFIIKLQDSGRVINFLNKSVEDFNAPNLDEWFDKYGHESENGWQKIKRGLKKRLMLLFNKHSSR